MSNFHGPQLPPNFRTAPVDEESSGEDEEKECAKESTPESAGVYFGPALPPKLKEQQETAPREKILGPCLPPGLLNANDLADEPDGNDDEQVFGPVLPGSEEEKRSIVHSRLEIQANEMRRKLAEKATDGDSSNIAARETWMLELPSASSAFPILGSRTFRKKEGPDMSDRSSWTDTPQSKKQNKEPKMDQKEESRKRAIEAKNELMEEELKKSKHSKREKSLLELHEKKLRKERKKKRKEKKKKNEPEERRCFSREIDLQVNRFDDAKRKAVIKRAGILGDRFSSGESKFL